MVSSESGFHGMFSKFGIQWSGLRIFGNSPVVCVVVSLSVVGAAKNCVRIFITMSDPW